MKWLRSIRPGSAVLPPAGWLNFYKPSDDRPPNIPPYCTWCGTEWWYVGDDDHMLCPTCDLFNPALYEGVPA